jgi:methionyl aminopeptidase
MLIKTGAEIKLISSGGEILGRILSELAKMCKPGISTGDVDDVAEKLIKEAGGKPSFKGFQNRSSDNPFPCAICASINEQLVHGFARHDVVLQDGDIFSIDIGMEYPCSGKRKGFFTDTAVTVAIGSVPEKTKALLRVTREALEVGIKAAKPGNAVSDIGRAIEEYVSAQGKYGIVRDLVGHGVGHAVHEDPRIPNYYDKNLEQWILRPGMVIAIEPMISLGGHKVRTATDGWAIEMSDKSLCAHFEHTVIINKHGGTVATRRPDEKGEKFW